MRILLVANVDWYLYNYRLPLAEALRARGDEVHLMCGTGDYWQRLQELGFPCYSWELSRQLSGPWRAWNEIHRLAHVVRKVRPDVVHFFTAKPVLYGGLAMRIRPRNCVVVNAPAGLSPIFSKPGLKAGIIRQGMKWLYRLACNGPAVQNILQNPDDVRDLQRWQVLRVQNYHVIRGSGVSIERFRPGPAAPARIPVVLMATRINAFKGVRDFVQAAKLLQQRGTLVQFALAGKPDRGMFSDIALEEIESWQRAGWIRYLGHCEDMVQTLRTCDVAVLPTRTREGVPRILIEAAAMAKPLVATDMPGCREIVVDGSTGFLVPLGHVTLLADRIAQLAGDAELRRQMGERGRKLVEAAFDERLVFADTFAVYDLACRRAAPATAAGG